MDVQAVTEEKVAARAMNCPCGDDISKCKRRCRLYACCGGVVNHYHAKECTSQLRTEFGMHTVMAGR